MYRVEACAAPVALPPLIFCGAAAAAAEICIRRAERRRRRKFWVHAGVNRRRSESATVAE